MIRYHQMLYFAEIVDRGSFSAAAKSLYVSQSALSQSMAGLEEELGAPLIRRSKNGVRLTYFGHRVYADAKRLIGAFQDCEAGWHDMLAERSSVAGQVRVHCNPGAEAYFSETVVPELAAAYPGVELVIRPSAEMREGFESFLNSGCALGIGVCSSEVQDDIRAQIEAAGLVFELFGSEVTQVLLSSRNPLAQEDALRPEQLSQLELVWYTFAPPPRCLPFFHGVAARVPNKESLVRMIANSDHAGIFAPSTLRRELAEFRGRVRLLPLAFQDSAFLSVVHYLIHAPEHELSRPAQCTLELLRHYPYTG